jgi:hypothetical protein
MGRRVEGLTDTPDMNAVKADIAGGITDGWGEAVEQSHRFGDRCVFDDSSDRWVKCSSKAPGSTREDGRYAMLLTLRGATLALRAG